MLLIHVAPVFHPYKTPNRYTPKTYQVDNTPLDKKGRCNMLFLLQDEDRVYAFLTGNRVMVILKDTGKQKFLELPKLENESIKNAFAGTIGILQLLKFVRKGLYWFLYH